MSDCAANVMAGNIPINIAIKSWYANQINEIYGKSMEEWQELSNNATKGR